MNYVHKKAVSFFCFATVINPQEAIRLYHTAVAERPDHYPPQSLYNMLGEAYVKDGDLTQGRLWYDKALAVKPDHVPAHLTMAHLAYIQVGRACLP